jgi:3-hydroxybutyryl-CoA dehydratase
MDSVLDEYRQQEPALGLREEFEPRDHPSQTRVLNEYRWQDLAVGVKHEFEATITEGMMERFLRDTGDHNPLHVDAPYAERNGFRGRVVYGLLTSSLYSTLAGVYLPGKYCLLHGIDVQFLRPVFVGDRLNISGEIAYLNEACRQAHINAHIVNGHGEKVSKARIRVGVLSTG